MAAMRKRFSSSAGEDVFFDTAAFEHLNDLQHPSAPLLSCHSVQDSLLSSNSSFTGYRGILNWIIILLVLTHTHLFLENFIQYGFLIDVRKVLGHLIEDNCNWPSVNLLLASSVFALASFLLERLQEKGLISPTTTHRLHLTNLGLLVVFPAAVILREPTISTGGAFFSLWFYATLGLKLYSYQESERWYRRAPSEATQTGHDEPHTFTGLCYFLLAPTLCYERSFPRNHRVRINKLLHRLLEGVVLIQIMVGIVQQWIEPIFRRSESSFCSMDATVRVELLVGLAAPTHFLWLLFFFLTHSYLNFCAELLRFGDRHFYGDWWNATTLMDFWKNWNIPFQKWCDRHVYSRLVERNLPSSQAELLVFLMSAALCEYLIALPLHCCRLWIFFTMVFETCLSMVILPGVYLFPAIHLLVAVLLGRYFHGNYGNGLVWLCLLLGPPLAVTTYFHDHYVFDPHRPRQPSTPADHRGLRQTL